MTKLISIRLRSKYIKFTTWQVLYTEKGRVYFFIHLFQSSDYLQYEMNPSIGLDYDISLNEVQSVSWPRPISINYAVSRNTLDPHSVKSLFAKAN